MKTVTTDPAYIEDRFGRKLEYYVHNVPYDYEEDGSYFVAGEATNRILELGRNLRHVAEQMNTEQRHLVVDIDYVTGRLKLRR